MKNVVIKLIIINAVVFLAGPFINIYYFGLIPQLVAEKGFIWQIVTYMFFHGNFFHLFVNMYALLIFGIEIERTWGSRRFLQYYFFTGIGAGICIFIINYFFFGGALSAVPTIGASGAVFGILLAFGVLFPESVILLFFVLPIKAKYLVILYGAFELYSLFSSGGGSGISHVGHVGGLLFGIIYFLTIARNLRAKKAAVKKRVEALKPASVSLKQVSSDKSRLTDILKKLKTKGFDSLSDDDYQLIQYMRIMHETDSSSKLCVPEDFDENDPQCGKCESEEACLIREIKKYI